MPWTSCEEQWPSCTLWTYLHMTPSGWSLKGRKTFQAHRLATNQLNLRGARSLLMIFIIVGFTSSAWGANITAVVGWQRNTTWEEALWLHRQERENQDHRKTSEGSLVDCGHLLSPTFSLILLLREDKGLQLVSQCSLKRSRKPWWLMHSGNKRN